MIDFKNPTKTQIIRFPVFVVCQLFCIASFAYMLVTEWEEPTKYLMCLCSMACLCLPALAEKVLKFRIPTPVYVCILVYAVCPMLGHSYNFYFKITWWDTLLHTTGGVVFALFGAYLPRLFHKDGECNVLLCALFGLCFSVTISAVWELVEYGCDMLLHTDMQQDTVVSKIWSYFLSDTSTSVAGSEEIQLIINGKVIDGYIDLGVIDTMTDVGFETLGAFVYSVVFLIDKGKHTGFHPIKKQAEQTEVPIEEKAEELS